MWQKPLEYQLKLFSSSSKLLRSLTFKHLFHCRSLLFILWDFVVGNGSWNFGFRFVGFGLVVFDVFVFVFGFGFSWFSFFDNFLCMTFELCCVFVLAVTLLQAQPCCMPQSVRQPTPPSQQLSVAACGDAFQSTDLQAIERKMKARGTAKALTAGMKIERGVLYRLSRQTTCLALRTRYMSVRAKS